MLDEVFQPSTTSTQVINPLRVSRNPILHKKIVPFEENPNIFRTQAPEPEQEAETDSDDLPDPELPIGHAQGALGNTRGRGRGKGRGGRGQGRGRGRGRARGRGGSQTHRMATRYSPVVETVSIAQDAAVSDHEQPLEEALAPIPEAPESPDSPETAQIHIMLDEFDLKTKHPIVFQIIEISERNEESNEYKIKLSDHRSWVSAILNSTHSIHIK